MLPRDIYLNAVTDLAPTVFLLAAVALYQARPGFAGVMVGLSVAAKLLPGLLMVVCCFPASARLRYAGGILLGLTPAVVFARRLHAQYRLVPDSATNRYDQLALWRAILPHHDGAARVRAIHGGGSFYGSLAAAGFL